jgi:y4mF family transcriptional regulator
MDINSPIILPNGKIVEDTKMIGKIVRQARKGMGLTQTETAALCNVGVRFLSELENGKPTVSLAKVFSILRGLGLLLVIRSKARHG